MRVSIDHSVDPSTRARIVSGPFFLPSNPGATRGFGHWWLRTTGGPNAVHGPPSWSQAASRCRSHGGSGADFCAVMSIHTTVAPPLA